MIVATHDFNMGAMENKGLNIFNSKYILAKPETATDEDFLHIASVIAHEYFHNWSGNRVTCRDWFQLSLKEGLTIFRDQSFTEDTFSPGVARIRDVQALRETQFPEDAGPLAHPVQPDAYLEINNFYTATVYNKGAEVIRMMQTILGKPLFRQGMDLYFQRHDGQAVTIEDFVKAMEDASGVDLKQFRRWYHQAGTPVLDISGAYDAAIKKYTLTFKQSCPPTPGQEKKQAFHVPVRVGLWIATPHKERGARNDAPCLSQTLQLREPEQSFIFDNIPTKPIPSLLQHFSAPVKIHYDYADEELLFLAKHDTDAFNRWEAGQKYAMRMLLRLVQDQQQGKALALPPELPALFSYLLQEKAQDKLLLNEMLVLPSEKYLGQQMPVVDVDAIHTVREFTLQTLAEQLQPLWSDCYQQLHAAQVAYRFTPEAVAKRQLKNRCLAYFARLPKQDTVAMAQLTAALTSNMTDTMAALRILANVDSPLRAQALAKFYETWQREALLVDKWLAVQATSPLPDNLQQVKKLFQHPAFDIKNPNKVYSLLGAFCQHNTVRFHAANGEGYHFLRECVLQLDKLNPLVAARMLVPLTTWKRYDNNRQKQMREQLQLILQNKTLSNDVYEIASKSHE